MNRGRRALLKLAGGVLAGGVGVYSRAGLGQGPQFRDADRTREKIVALVRAFGDKDPRALLHIQKIEPVTIRIPEVKVRPEHLPLMDYFVGDLYLRWSFDDPKHVSSVSASDLKRLKLTREELPPLATANFRRLYPNFKVERVQTQLASVSGAGELEPSLMLDARFWDQERERAKSEIVAAVPARDSLLFTSRAAARNIELLKGVVMDVFETAGTSSLSRKLFLWNQGRWELFS